jgi:hypothetical protein
VGQVVLALTVVPRYRHQSIADLQSLVLEPLLRDHNAVAAPAGGEGADAPDGGAPGGPGPAEEDGRGRRWRGGMNGRQAFWCEGVDAESKSWLICVQNVAFVQAWGGSGNGMNKRRVMMGVGSTALAGAGALAASALYAQ